MRLINLLLASAVLLSACVSGPTKQDKPDTQVPTDNAATLTSKSVKQSVKTDPAFTADYEQALASMRAGNHTQAKAQLQTLHKKQPRLTGPLINLGIILQIEKDPVGAEKSFREALKHDPKNAVAHNQLGVALRQQGKFAEAEQAYASALLSNPDYRLAHRNIGILYDLYLQQPDKALHHYQRCQELRTEPDKTLTAWISDMERRLKAGEE